MKYPYIFLLFASMGMMQAQSPLQCSASSVPSSIRAEGGAELAGDYVVTCTGGAPTQVEVSVPTYSLALTFNTNVTSRVLAPGWSEALLLVDEPSERTQMACANGTGVCAIQGTGNGSGTYSGFNARPNIFQAQSSASNPNQIVIDNFPLDAPGSGQRVLRFTNLRVNAVGAPATITATLSIASRAGQITVANASRTVALAQSGAAVQPRFVQSGANGITQFTVTATENFANAFKTRSSAPFAGNDTSSQPANQTLPGATYPISETGFHNGALPSIAGRGNLGLSGVADSGTRVLVAVGPVPAGVTLSTFAGVNLTSGGSNYGSLRLISADSTGSGPFSPSGTCCGMAALATDANGTARAVFEVLNTNAGVAESADIPFVLSYSAGAPAVSSLSVTASIAPASSVTTADSASPLPRFNSLKTFPLSAIVISPASLPPAITGSPYTVQFSAAGGAPPYSWVAGSVLPPGFTLSGSGVLSGTPQSSGNLALTVVVGDSAKNTATNQYTITAGTGIQITPATLPNGSAGVPYSQTLGATGGTPPYTFSAVGSLPVGLTLSTGGILSGTTPNTGTFSITVMVADSAQNSVRKQYSVTFANNSPLLTVSRTSLTFSAIVSGDAPPPQDLAVISTAGPAVNFQLTIDGGVANTPAPSWLTVRLSSGVTPASLVVSTDQTGLAAGTYNARLRFSVAGNTSVAPVDVLVTLTVGAATQQLEVTPSFPASLKLTARASAPGVQEAVVYARNSGGGAPIPFSVATLQQSSWIVGLTPSSGTTMPNALLPVTVRIDTQGLQPGSYRDVIRFTWSGASVDVPVSVFVSEPGPVIAVDVTGQRFESKQGGGYTIPHAVRVSNVGDPGTIVNFTAEILNGDSWLAVGDGSGATGSVAAGQSVSVTLSGKAASADRPVGGSYGLVRISDPNANNSPQYVVIVLDQAPSTAPTLPNFAPGPLSFTYPAGSGPQTVTVNVYASSPTPTQFFAAGVTYDGTSWLTVTPQGVASTSSPGVITAQINAASLAPGIHKAQINVTMSGVVRTKDVTVIITPPGASTISAVGGRAAASPAAGCAPANLAITQAGVADSFAIPAGWPATLIIKLSDDCGTPVLNGSVSVSFSNGDPPLSLISDHTTGAYTATWQPGIVTQQMTIKLRASAAGFPQATAQMSGAINENVAPILSKNGTVNAFSRLAAGALTPGTVVEVYGSGLAAGAASAPSVPLPPVLQNTLMLVGNLEAPIFFVSGPQLDVQIPNELKPNQQYPVIISANGALTIPDIIDVVPTQPGVAQFPDGGIIAQHAVDFSLVDAGHPAKPGEFIIMYLVGMGATTITVASGTAAPGPPFAEATEKPTVTVDGQSSEVGFAGMTPGGVGLFQINFKVPDGAASGNLEVVVKQGTQTANITRLPVQR